MLREWLNSNPKVVAGLAAVLVVAALGWLVAQLGGSETPDNAGRAWYLDMKTGELFRASATRVPPIQSPDGNDAVRAVVFSCGKCDEKKERFIGYYEKLPKELKKAFKGNPEAVPARQHFVVMAAKTDGAFQRPPLDESELKRVRNGKWVGQGSRPPRRAGAGARRQQRAMPAAPERIRAAPRRADVCSGGVQPRRCRP